MASEEITIPEGLVEIPVGQPQEGNIIPPAGLEEIPIRPPSAGQSFVEGAAQGFSERGMGYTMLGKEAQSMTSFILGLPTQELRQEMRDLYREYSTGRTDYEAAGQILPKGAKAIRTAGEIGANIVTDLPLAIATGGRTAAGRLGTSMLIGATEGSTLPAGSQEERTRNAALGAAFGGTGTIGFEAARLKANIIDRHLRNALAVPEIVRRYEESNVLSKMTGIDFTTGQATGSPTLLAYENMAANALGSTDEALAQRNKQLIQSINYLKGSIARLGDADAGPDVVGEQLKNAMLKTKDDLVEIRSGGWDYFMDKATIASGNNPIGTPTNTAAALDKIIDEMKHPASGFSPAIIKHFENLRGEVSKPWTVKDFQTTMKTWGRNAAGTSQPFEALHVTDQQRVYREALSAMRKDLDDLATKGGVQGEAVKQLNLARDQWKRYSEHIDELELTVLGDAIDKVGRPVSAEDLYKKVRKMPASELRRIVPLMDTVDPKIMNNVRARIFNDAFEKASAKSDSPTALVEFDPSAFFKEVTSQPNAKEIFKGADMKEYMAAVAAMKRLARWSGEGAALSPAQTERKAAALVGGGLQAGGMPSMVFLAQFLAENLTPNRYAKLLMTPEGRNAVIALGSREIKSRKAWNASVGTLVGFLTSPDTLEYTPPEEPALKGTVEME